jgi:competence protein ComEC
MRKILHKLTAALTDCIDKERARYMTWIPVLFGCGIGLYFLWPTEPSALGLVLIFEALLAAAYMFRRVENALLAVSALLIVCLGFADIALQSRFRAKSVAPVRAEEMLYLKGRIIRTDHNARGRFRVYLDRVRGETEPLQGLYRLTLSDTSEPFHAGQCVEAVATLLPDSVSVMPDSYQFGRKNFFDGLSASGYVNGRMYEIPCQERPSLRARVLFGLWRLRHRIKGRIVQILPPDEAGIAVALMTGLRDGIDRQTTQNYRNSGLAHFLSISGLHIGMIAALAFFLMRFFFALIPPVAARYDTKKAAAVAAVIVSFFYLLLSGAQIPTCRAFMMTFLVLLGVLFDRRAVSMRTVAVAATVILVISPQALINIGFQMSFAAVVAMIAFYERFLKPVNGFLSGRNVLKTIAAYFIGLMLSDLIASLATLPYSIYHFRKIAVYTTLGNLAAGPIIGFVIMPFLLLALVGLPFGAAVVPLRVVGRGIGLVNRITAAVAALPEAGLIVPPMPFYGLVLLTLGGLWLCLWTRAWRLWGLIPIAVGLISPFLSAVPDALYDAEGKTIAVRAENGCLVVMPHAADRWRANLWTENEACAPLSKARQKTLKQIYDGRKTEPSWIDLSCDGTTCRYKGAFAWEKNGRPYLNGEPIDPSADGGGAVFLSGQKPLKRTVCQAAGVRPWNDCR